ncbi:MAG: ribonuclease M5 [Desulfitobacteriaceae bacterium]
MIQELIVVEGKNDAHAIRRALGEVDVLWTEGYGLSSEKLDYISEMAKRRGVIVLTDPDSVGEQIRERIRRRVPEAKHVYLSQKAARRKQDIGVENASVEEIKRAFAHIRQSGVSQGNFRMEDLWKAGLVGEPEALIRRRAVGRSLGIGEANAKQFLHRLNRFGISLVEFWQVVEEVKHGGGS